MEPRDLVVRERALEHRDALKRDHERSVRRAGVVAVRVVKLGERLGHLVSAKGEASSAA